MDGLAWRGIGSHAACTIWKIEQHVTDGVLMTASTRRYESRRACIQ